MRSDSRGDLGTGSSESKQLPFRILLVEDDSEIADRIKTYLEREEFEVLVESRGNHAISRIERDQPDLVLLDIMLPGTDGFAVCRLLRQSSNPVPVVIVTARDDQFDEVVGLELGADEYLTKPIEPRVMLARIRAVLRRRGKSAALDDPGEALVFGELRIDRIRRSVTYAGTDIPLCSADFDLFWLFASNPGRPISRNQILLSMTGRRFDGFTRAVDSRVFRLRRELAAYQPLADLISTARGQGYIFCPPK